MNDDSPDYPIGYKKPPLQTRFQQGKSGNPKGRPKGSKNLATVIHEELNQTVSVTENGKTKQLKKREIVAKQLVTQAIKGDLKAIHMVISQAGTDPSEAAGPNASDPFHRDDRRVIATIVKRVQSYTQSPPGPDSPEPDSEEKTP